MTDISNSEVGYGGVAGRIAAVTGAAQGIGRAVAEALLAGGARVALLDVRAPEDRSALDQADNTMFAECDVTSEASVDAAFSLVEAAWGPVDILVNNAGIFAIQPLEETDLGDWEQMMAVNLTGCFLCSKRVLPKMRERGWGRVISIGSSAGKTGGSKNAAAYGASKAGVMALAKAIATEYAPFGITSNALAPALINTDMVAGIADLADRIPVGRLGRPTDVAQAALFLAGEQAEFITGEVMDVNGGFLID